MYRVFTIYMMPIWFRYEYQYVNYSFLIGFKNKFSDNTPLVLNFVTRDKYHIICISMKSDCNAFS